MRVVHFRYAEGTEIEDKVSAELLHVHLAIGHVFNAIGMAEAEVDEDGSYHGQESNNILGRNSQAGDGDVDFWAWNLSQRLLMV